MAFSSDGFGHTTVSRFPPFQRSAVVLLHPPPPPTFHLAFGFPTASSCDPVLIPLFVFLVLRQPGVFISFSLPSDAVVVAPLVRRQWHIVLLSPPLPCRRVTLCLDSYLSLFFPRIFLFFTLGKGFSVPGVSFKGPPHLRASPYSSLPLSRGPRTFRTNTPSCSCGLMFSMYHTYFRVAVSRRNWLWRAFRPTLCFGRCQVWGGSRRLLVLFLMLAVMSSRLLL